MADAPILILQMQRLGDLVLTFPLLGWLQRRFPNNPLWVVGEELFFKHLMPLSPNVTYFSYSAATMLQSQHYHCVINISHRPEALDLASSLHTDTLLGAYRTKEGAVHINGDWQLYRASLVNNNRHNQFHWADLNGLDIIPRNVMRLTRWPMPRAIQKNRSAHIGLFLGASEEAKRPDSTFWVELSKRLLLAGHKPVLLGGEHEKTMGHAVANELKANALNLTGRFSISELTAFFQNLDLLVTPDTGPMHVAAWTGTPTLNLSMGPVNAWETGPFSPGHLVLRSSLSCVACWGCTQPSILCKERFSPSRTASLIHTYMTQGDDALRTLSLPGQELFTTSRDMHVLFDLQPYTTKHDGRHAVGKFWRDFFGAQLGALPKESQTIAWRQLTEISPRVAEKMTQNLARLNRELARNIRQGKGNLDSSLFWTSFPPILRPLTSYMQLLLQNELFSKQAFTKTLHIAEELAELVK